jgi:putative ABC transport system permease protein
MLNSYFKLAFKNMFRNRTVSVIHLAGLSIGSAVCTLIALFVHHHLSFDQFHSGYGRTARIATTMKYPGASESTTAYSSMPMGAFMQETFEKEVETFCRLQPIDDDIIVKNGETRVTLGQIFTADSSFFRVFGFRLLQGDPLRALVLPRRTIEDCKKRRYFVSNLNYEICRRKKRCRL